MSKTKTTTLENGIIIEIIAAENTITVEAEVPNRALATQRKVTCNNNTITRTLEEEGIEVGALISGTTISNSKSGTKLNGRWTFEVPKTTTTTRTKATTKTTTVADNRTKTRKRNTKTTKVPVEG